MSFEVKYWDAVSEEWVSYREFSTQHEAKVSAKDLRVRVKSRVQVVSRGQVLLEFDR